MTLKLICAALSLAALIATPMAAQTPAFESGWSLDETASTLNFLSVKEGAVMELSRFDKLQGVIAEDGTATLTVPLDGIDTNIDLRNVRMRLMFFETFLYPQATITAVLTQDIVDDLEALGTKNVTLPFDIDLHGATQTLQAEVQVTLIGRDRVSVSSITPVILSVADFGLLDGLEKLQEAADVVIVPTTAVSFNATFVCNTTSLPVPPAPAQTTSVALEPAGNFDQEACIGRFEILSRSGNISFDNDSATLKPNSAPILAAVVDIVSRCPGMLIEIAGHTDSFGDQNYNQTLSEQRAASVVAYLVDAGLTSDRFVSGGFGETQPIATNDTASCRERNRRISFSVLRTGE